MTLEINTLESDEYCPHCAQEVKLSIFDGWVCPSCGQPILPCSLCVDKKCAECVLHQNYEKLNACYARLS